MQTPQEKPQPEQFINEQAVDLQSEVIAQAAPPDEILISHSEHIATVPNSMTALRGLMAIALPIYMRRGGKYASVGAVIGAASDKESTVADLIDKKHPGWGRSELGKRADPIADTAFRAGVGAGVLISPKTSGMAKLAATLNTAKVIEQTAWAVKADKKHRNEFGTPLVADVDKIGKIATATMLASTGLGALTGDLNPNKRSQSQIRNAAGVASIGLAIRL